MLDRLNDTVEADKIRAMRDAANISAYWIDHGYLGIHTEIVYVPTTSKHMPSWGVRSNIGPNGFPPRQ